MSAFKEALEHLAAIEDAEERGLQAALLDGQIASSVPDTGELDGIREELERTKGEFEDMKRDYAELKVRYADLYFSGADDRKPVQGYNVEKPTTLKDILG